jgi:hypothetical protein
LLRRFASSSSQFVGRTGQRRSPMNMKEDSVG